MPSSCSDASRRRRRRGQARSRARDFRLPPAACHARGLAPCPHLGCGLAGEGRRVEFRPVGQTGSRQQGPRIAWPPRGEGGRIGRMRPRSTRGNHSEETDRCTQYPGRSPSRSGSSRSRRPAGQPLRSASQEHDQQPGPEQPGHESKRSGSNLSRDASLTPPPYLWEAELGT